MMWYGHEGMGWWMLFGGVWLLLFWGAIIGLVVWGISRVTHRGYGPRAPDRLTPLDIAKERYAKGELSKEEFEQIKKDLG